MNLSPVLSSGAPLISDEWRKINAKLHEDPNYGIQARFFVNQVAAVAEACQARSILDYGCGKRYLERGLRQVWKGAPLCEILNYDPAIEGLEFKKPCDLVVCIDVLEHIEPEKLDDVLGDLRDLVIKRGFFSIATRPSRRILPDGRNAHLIQKPYSWWLQKLWSRFRISAFENMDPTDEKELWVVVQ